MKVHLAVPGKKTACGIPAGGFRNDRKTVMTAAGLERTGKLACRSCKKAVKK
jgi:hypothetical protein